jgi:hypothetical protein
MPIAINGSGTITGISAGGLPDSSIVTADIADANVTPEKLSQPLTIATAKTASGTSVDFTGIPLWAKRITVIFTGVSTNGTSNYQIQVGTSSVFTTSGYVGSVANQAGTTAANSTGFQVANTQLATDLMWGKAEIVKTGGNPTQVLYTSILANSNAANMRYGAGAVTPANPIDAIRITTVNGTDTFDGGIINVMYEG